jgi:hypothetical protein
VIGKAKGLAGHLAHKGFAQSKTRLYIDFIILTIGRILGMDHISILSWNNLLDKHSHVDLMERNSNFLGSQKGPLVKL